MDDGIDFGTIGALLFIIGIITVAVLGVLWMKDTYDLAPYREICEKDINERYAQSCTSKEECITLCASRLEEAAS